MLQGAAGTGKSALLDHAAELADGCRVVRAVGVESEMELPFAGLHQLCADLLDGLDGLPGPQREALETAFGLVSGPQPDRFLISLATLSLLSNAAEPSPLLCLVDDAHWLDRSSAQVLAFVARRLNAEAVVLIFAVRDSLEPEELAGLPHLQIEGLPDEHARELLASSFGAPLDDRVRERILAEARGNPLALLELPRAVSPAKLAGGFGLPGGAPLQSRIERSFLGRVQQLPLATRRFLLLAAAEPTGDPDLLWRSAAELEIPIEAVAPALGDGMLNVGARVAFRHPLLRSAIYGAAAAEDRRAVHQALAAATDAEADPDRRAWHRARAALGPDEDIASELERSAGRAQARGGVAAAAAFLQRAVELTMDPGKRARRALEAAAAKQLAGAPDAALALLSTAGEGPLEEFERAMVSRLYGQLLLDLRRAGDAVPLLLEAARRLESLDPGLARETYLEALRAASVAGRLGGGVREVAIAARSAPPRPGPRESMDLLLDGLAIRFTDGYAASAEALKEALDALRDEGARADVSVRWPWIGRRVAPDLLDDETWHAITTRNVQITREVGAVAVLPLALNAHALLLCCEGQLDAAAAVIEDADEIAEATGAQPVVIAKVLLAGCRGDERQSMALIEASEAAAVERREGVILTFGEYARALLLNARGQHAEALAPARSAAERDELMLSVLSLPELVEAASRSGRHELAATAVERLSERTQAAGTELALGIEARARALVAEPEVAEDRYREAIERLGRSRFTLDLARGRLLFGEWLRREHRRIDARAELRRAHEMFESMGAQGFAARARRELLATGETVRARTPETIDELTAQETQIAQLARDGLSNPEIGARLFISPRTVQYHLRKVFAKLEISSRTELIRALPRDPKAA